MVFFRLFSQLTNRPDFVDGAHPVPSGGIIRILPLQRDAQGLPRSHTHIKETNGMNGVESCMGVTAALAMVKHGVTEWFHAEAVSVNAAIRRKVNPSVLNPKALMNRAKENGWV